MKFALVDDDEMALERLENILTVNYGDIAESIDKFSNPIEFLRSNTEYDLLFLDIEMPRITGIELSKNEAVKHSNIIFVTSKESLVFEAYNDTNSIGFVRKNKLNDDLKSVMQRFVGDAFSKKYLAAKIGGIIIKVPYNDILYIENSSNYVNIYTSHSVYNKRYKISDLEKELEEFGFIRCHAGFIVNLKYVDYIGERELRLSNDASIPLSRKRVKEVREKFLRFNGV